MISENPDQHQMDTLATKLINISNKFKYYSNLFII